MGKLFGIVDQANELPLAADFGASAEGKAVAALMLTGIGGDGGLIAHLGFHGLDHQREEFLFRAGALGLGIDDNLVIFVHRRHTHNHEVQHNHDKVTIV